MQISEEIKEALQTKRPIVSLESTIITHGLPFPENIKMAKQVEQVIRDNGAVPATTAFINGIPKVGLSLNEIEELASFAKQGEANKVSRRDIAYTISNKLYGGTTIASTMILSEYAGIKVFATGGLGGVHRGGELTLDISADLEELGRTPVAVVCAGPKAILDIPRTMEYLETKGCMVATWGSVGTNVPGFYTRDSGVMSPYNFSSYHQAAQIIHDGIELGLKSGYLFCIPPPKEIALDDDYINQIIEEANLKAAKLSITGKELTPYLLNEISLKSGGASVKSNVGFVLNNAKAAAKIAVSLSKLENDEIGSFDPSFLPTIDGLKTNLEKSQSKTKTSIVIGAVALDTHCKIDSSNVRNLDSNPGIISSSIGGVGHNVASSANLCNRSDECETILISSVGNDSSGRHIIAELGMKTEGIHVDKSISTAQYVSVHSSDGELIIGCSDMDIVTRIPIEHISEKIETFKPDVVLVDGNVSVKILNHLVSLRRKFGFKLIFEPTSQSKAKRIGLIHRLRVYPNNDFFLITPTVDELRSIYSSFDDSGKFDLDNWFPVLDRLKIDSNLSSSKQKNHKGMRDLLERGIIQMASFLLPYFPKIIVKDGPNGIYIFSIEKNVTHSILDEIANNCDFFFYSEGDVVNDITYGVLMEYHGIPDKNVTVKNVTGAGDVFAGVLLNQLTMDNTALEIQIPSLKKKSLDRAQKGAKITIEDNRTISLDLKNLP